MGTSGVEDRSKRKRVGRQVGGRLSALKDAIPESQPRGRIKSVDEGDEGPAAENDEEDD